MRYELLNDNLGNPYFAFLTDPAIHFNSSLVEGNDFTNFNQRFITVNQRVTGPFSRDLTSAGDDVIIALIALLLLLIIDGIITTILLRSSQSRLRPFSFSVKLVLELVRDLNVPALQRRSTRRDGRVRRLPRRLLVAAIALLSLVFGLEAVVLILTEPHTRPMFNTQATIRVLRPITPQWRNVRFNFRASLDRPCSAMQILGVVQKNTRINACVTSNLTGQEVKLFEQLDKNAGDVPLTITTFVHDYGMDHLLTVDNGTAEFASRAYYSLDDERPRLMPAIGPNPKFEAEQVRMIHTEYIGYLFTIYWRATKKKDEAVTEEYLNSLPREFVGPEEGPDIVLVKVNGRPFKAKSTKYVTKSMGRFPRGSPALRVGHHTFRTSIGLQITEGNATDLFLDSGVETRKAVLWHEESRSMNWLTLIVTVGVAFSLLITLRFILKPIAAVDVAATLVKRNVHADMDRGPLELASDETSTFRLYRRDTEYSLGAETGQRISREYQIDGFFSGTESATEPGSRRSNYMP